MRKLLTGILLGLFVIGAVSAQDAGEMIREIDRNMDYATVQYSIAMEITNSGRTHEKHLRLWKKGNRYSYIEFTNPEDRGNKYLQIGGQVWLYSPDMEDSLPLSRHMLRESMMGSDLSYEDIADSSTYESRYEVEMTREEYSYEGETPFEGEPVVELTLQAKDRRQTYQKIVMQVDMQNNFPVQMSYFSPSGALLKDTLVYEISNVDGILFASRAVTTDSFRSNSRTAVELSSIRVNENIPDSFFSRSKLR